MREHLRIRLTRKDHAFGLQFIVQFGKIFNDAVMHERNAPACNMRVRVFHNGLAVRGPAGVGNTDRAVDFLVFDLLNEFMHTLHGARTTDFSVFNHRNAAAVVAAVLKTP